MKHEEFFINRHTVRKYSDQKIDNELLKKMINAATHAPNTGNMQWYSVVVTRSAENKAKLAPAHFNQPSVTGCDAVLTFCLDLRRFEQWCRLNNAEPGFNNFQSFIAAIIDTSLFAQQFNTIAEANGLGCCYLGTTTYNAPQIIDALALPERVVPVTTLTVGYPEAEGESTWRLPVDILMHEEIYHEPSDEKLLIAYSSLESQDAMKAFVKDNNKQSLAQVFTDIRYPRESAEYFSKIYEDVLRRNNF